MEELNHHKNIIIDFYTKGKEQLSYLTLVHEKISAEIKALKESKYYELKRTYDIISMIIETTYIILREDVENEIFDELISFIEEAVNSTNFTSEFVYSEFLETFSADQDKGIEELYKYYECSDEDYEITHEYRDNEIVLMVKFKNFKAKESFVEFIEKDRQYKNQIDILLKTALIDATNSFEYLISNTLEYYASKYPSYLNSEDVKVSKVLESEDIDALKKKIISDYSRKIMFKDRKGWFDELKKRNGNFKKEFKDNNVDSLEEIFNIRNAIVHNGAKLNEDCLEHFKDKKIGDKIPLNKEFVEGKAKELLYIGILSSYLLTISSEKDRDENFIFFEQRIGLDLIRHNIADLAERVYSFLWLDKEKVNNTSRLMLAINYALSLKEQNKDFKDILKQVDFSVSWNAHKLCLAALDDQTDETLNFFKLAVEERDNKYGYNDIVQWPIMRDIVKKPQFIDFSKEHFPKESEFFYPKIDNDDTM